MIVAIHQPNFLPWLGFFYKISKSDVFVLLDDVQYSKNSFINRNRIKSAKGEQWLTMPVMHSGKFGQSINEVEIPFFEKNYKKLLHTIQLNYSKSKYYTDIMQMFENYHDFNVRLSEFNEYFITWILQYLNINTSIYKSSEMKNIQGQSTDRLVSICKELKADKYLAGFGSNKYQENEKFISQGIETIVYDFVHPIYPQLWNNFIPNLSIIDLLMNMGKESSKFFSK